MQKKNGKRVTGGGESRKHRRRSNLTGVQKALLAIVICLAVALAAVIAYKNLFVRPDIDKAQGVDGTGTEQIDYGDGVRPRAVDLLIFQFFSLTSLSTNSYS